ncbi:unnamed protein product [Paramecium sonneborni]|uniref:Uncharacterized protein n=1 Tax=Paramecium sonneborni TaxID=65129 RepID=A0A8S1RNL1_9CILI|nr:unnamed protein product [Paramecium sonneborni]
MQIDWGTLREKFSIEITEFKEEKKESINARKKEKKKVNKYEGDRYKSYFKEISFDWASLADIIPIWNRYTRWKEDVTKEERQKKYIGILEIQRLMNIKYTFSMRLVPLSPNIRRITKLDLYMSNRVFCIGIRSADEFLGVNRVCQNKERRKNDDIHRHIKCIPYSKQRQTILYNNKKEMDGGNTSKIFNDIIL